MNISGFMLKFNTILSSGASRLSSLIAAESKIQNTFDASSMTSATFTFLKNGIVNFVVKLIYIICHFILNIIEVIELTINRLLGINIDLKDYTEGEYEVEVNVDGTDSRVQYTSMTKKVKVKKHNH